jgi:hypothetical protein
MRTRVCEFRRTEDEEWGRVGKTRSVGKGRKKEVDCSTLSRGIDDATLREKSAPNDLVEEEYEPSCVWAKAALMKDVSEQV